MMHPPPEVRFRERPVKKPGQNDTLSPSKAWRGDPNPYQELSMDPHFLTAVQGAMLEPVVTRRTFPKSEFPELVVWIPDEYEEILLAPVYDAHIGAAGHDAELFAEHMKWIADTPNVVTWNGGDSIENANKFSPGAGVFHQTRPQRQIFNAIEAWASVRHKTLFSLSGNHEDRIEAMGGIDISQWIAQVLDVPHFPGYCACRLKWRKLNINILAHHGSGAAQTAGGQLNNIRKDLPWAHGFDLYWFGHTHRSMHSKEFRIMHNPRTDRLVQRECFAILSPSYLKYFGSYAEKKRYSPTTRGMAVVRVNENGRLDFEEHAKGQRF